MALMPFQILGIWLRGLLAFALPVVGIFLSYDWWQHRYISEREVARTDAAHVRMAEGGAKERSASEPGDPDVQTEYVQRVKWSVGLNRPTFSLLGALAFLGLSAGGGLLGTRLIRTLRSNSSGGPEPTDASASAAVIDTIRRPDGTVLHVESFGAPDGPVIILTHGWGLDGAEWVYLKRRLANHYRLICWDLPGLGKSGCPNNKDWSLEKLAADLDAVVSLAKGRPAILVGHSIGGMIALTFCRLFPERVTERIGGLVLVHSTYTNPVRTTRFSGFYTVLQNPILKPLLHATIWLTPLVWAANCLSYLNGSAHRSTNRSSFSGRESWQQLDFITRYTLTSPPNVLARGMLAMLQYDATSVLPQIRVPTLVVAGDGDRTCTPAASAFMSGTIPGAALLTLAPARHCGHFERNRQFLDQLETYLARWTLAQSTAGVQVEQKSAPILT